MTKQSLKRLPLLIALLMFGASTAIADEINKGAVIGTWDQTIKLPSSGGYPGVNAAAQAARDQAEGVEISLPDIGSPEADRAADSAHRKATTTAVEHSVEGYRQQIMGGDKFTGANRILERERSHNQHYSPYEYQKPTIGNEMSISLRNEAMGLPEGSNPYSKPRYLNDHERVVIFISSSVPVATLREYVRAIDAIGDPNIFMVMRGFIGGAKKGIPTLRWLSELVLKDPSCVNSDPLACDGYNVGIEIDPELFAEFSPSEVPAIVYDDGKTKAGLYGDVSLDYALKVLRTSQPTE